MCLFAFQSFIFLSLSNNFHQFSQSKKLWFCSKLDYGKSFWIFRVLRQGLKKVQEKPLNLSSLLNGWWFHQSMLWRSSLSSLSYRSALLIFLLQCTCQAWHLSLVLFSCLNSHQFPRNSELGGFQLGQTRLWIHLAFRSIW